MNRYTVHLGALLLLSSLLWACGPGSDPGDPTNPGGCGPFGCREPEPGWAKFTVGNAESVRWLGFDGCHAFDVRTGELESNGLTKVEGVVSRSGSCDPDIEQGHFEFVYRQHSLELSAESWTTAYRPLDAVAAKELIRNCTWETRPEPSSLIGHWWHATNLYAENQILDYIAPLAYASSLIPFDDDGFERVGEESVDGVPTIQFQNDRATVWMVNDGSRTNRPLRVTGRAHDVTFSEWDVPFAAEIPENLRDLSEVCAVQ
ncbi:MAG TPA: hypothetical protein VK013_02710 [Myxococcaceae bacterium]|nr:hypothetical protein [Myxococcaceae bacterium]